MVNVILILSFLFYTLILMPIGVFYSRNFFLRAIASLSQDEIKEIEAIRNHVEKFKWLKNLNLINSKEYKILVAVNCAVRITMYVTLAGAIYFLIFFNKLK